MMDLTEEITGTPRRGLRARSPKEGPFQDVDLDRRPSSGEMLDLWGIHGVDFRNIR